MIALVIKMPVRRKTGGNVCDKRSRRVDLGVDVLSIFSALSLQHDCPGH